MPPAARISDFHTCPLFNPGTPPPPHVGGPIAAGCPTVIIGGMPAARLGDMAVCAGPPDTIAKGSATVIIGGMPAARLGDNTAHGGVIVAGCPTVIIGDVGMGGAQGVALSAAKKSGAAFCEKCAAAARSAAAQGAHSSGNGVPQAGGGVRGALSGASQDGKVGAWPDHVGSAHGAYGSAQFAVRAGKAAYYATRYGQSASTAMGKAATRAWSGGGATGVGIGIAVGGALKGVEAGIRNRGVWGRSKSEYVGRVGYAATRGAVSAATTTATGAVAGAVIGGIVGSVFPGPGTVAGAVLGAKVGAMVSGLVPGLSKVGDVAGRGMDRLAGGTDQASAESNIGTKTKNAFKRLFGG